MYNGTEIMDCRGWAIYNSTEIVQQGKEDDTAT